MPMPTIPEKLYDLIEFGLKLENYTDYSRWGSRVHQFLSHASPKDAIDFTLIADEGEDIERWRDVQASEIGFLEGLAAKIQQAESGLATLSSSPQLSVAPTQSKKVFVVRGHDNETKQTVARFLERLKLEPIILHEQANEGRTVIEKFEVYADVGFAVVLLTPDDVGARASEAADLKTLKARARQNVVMELGYFLGKLKRNRVCALYKNGVEIPSDFQGVLYVELDAAGGWLVKLAQELSAAGIPIDLEALIKKS
jgi:predicted nucleotide-binding protein